MVYTNIDDLMKQFKHIMIDNDIKQKDICESTNMSKQAISNLLNCRTKNITLDTLTMLCNSINCNLIIDIKPKDET